MKNILREVLERKLSILITLEDQHNRPYIEQTKNMNIGQILRH